MSETFRVFPLILTSDYQLKLFGFKFNETCRPMCQTTIVENIYVAVALNERHEQFQIIAIMANYEEINSSLICAYT